MSYVRELRSAPAACCAIAILGHRPLIIAGAAVLIFIQHRRDNQQWGLISGSMEIKESLEDRARREVIEETGLELNELNWFGLFSGKELIYQIPNGDVVVNVTAVYTSRKFKEKLKVDKEQGYEVRFFNLNEIPKDLSPPDKPVINQYLRSLENSNA